MGAMRGEPRSTRFDASAARKSARVLKLHRLGDSVSTQLWNGLTPMRESFDARLMKFAGFSPAAIKFLKGLDVAKNNNKAWFDKNRSTYEAELLEPSKAFVVALGEKINKFSPEVQAEPKVNGSIFRINRDIRFSKDKTPYNPHMSYWFWEGADKRGGNASGYYLRLTKNKVMLGGGMHGMSKEVLERFRKAVADDGRGETLVKLLKAAGKAGYEAGGAHYKRVPKGYDPEHARADLLRHNALYVGADFSHPDSIGKASFATWCAGHFKKLAGVQAWLASLS